MSVLVSYGRLKFNLVNIYAPNILTSRKTFFAKLHEFFLPNAEPIVGDDFNYIDSTLDKQGGNKTIGFTGNREVAKLKTDFNLYDIWRHQHKNKIENTWTNTRNTIFCRLDKFLVPKTLVNNQCTSDIKPFIFSDHDIIHVSLDLSTFVQHGSGVWRFNTSLLSDSEYIDVMNQFFVDNPRPMHGSLLAWWDYFKTQMKSETTFFCKRKAHVRRARRISLFQDLTKAKTDLIQGIPGAASKVKSLENEIKNLDRTELEGAKIRSRSKWIEQGEKPTRYFFSLEKIRANDNFIHSLLKPDATEASSTAEISSTITDLYQNLYTAEPTDPSLQASEMLNNLENRLSPAESELCERLFTVNE